MIEAGEVIILHLFLSLKGVLAVKQRATVLIKIVGPLLLELH